MKKPNFYVDGKSLMHTLHPSTKLVLYACLIVEVNLLNWQERWVLAIALFVTLLTCGVPPWRYKLMAAVLSLGTVAVPLLNGIWALPGDPVLFPIIDGVAIHRNGLETGLGFAGLYFALGMATITWITTTRLWHIADAPSVLGMPPSVGFALSYTFRYIPEVAQHYLNLSEVWQTRGVDFNKGGVVNKFWLRSRLLATLLILELSSARSKSHAIEARGFSLKRKPTIFILPPLPRSQKIVVILAIFATFAHLVAYIVSLAV